MLGESPLSRGEEVRLNVNHYLGTAEEVLRARPITCCCLGDHIELRAPLRIERAQANRSADAVVGEEPRRHTGLVANRGQLGRGMCGNSFIGWSVWTAAIFVGAALLHEKWLTTGFGRVLAAHGSPVLPGVCTRVSA